MTNRTTVEIYHKYTTKQCKPTHVGNTREGDHNKKSKKPHMYPSMLNVVHEKYAQATTTPPAAGKQVCYVHMCHMLCA